MNAERRQSIDKAKAALEQVQAEMEVVRDEESLAMDNLPENMQGGEKFSKMEEAVGYLDSLISNVEDAISEIANLEGMA